jgi:hypothetical protein
VDRLRRTHQPHNRCTRSHRFCRALAQASCVDRCSLATLRCTGGSVTAESGAGEPWRN